MTSISIDKVDLTSITKYMVPIRISALFCSASRATPYA